jgi:hypothetical protein
LGKAINVNRQFPFNISESNALTFLAADPTHANAIDLLLIIIKSNVTTPNPQHVTNAHVKAILDSEIKASEFLNSYNYYLSYSDLINYQLSFPHILTKKAITELTSNLEAVVKGSDSRDLIVRYLDIKQKIFDSNIEACKLFISKINGFYKSNESLTITNENLNDLTWIICDCYSLKIPLTEDLITQANSYIDDLTIEDWSEALKQSTVSSAIQLLNNLLKLNLYRHAKLPANAFRAYSDVIISISKKVIEAPPNLDFWNNLLTRLDGSFVYVFKNVRDELINHNHEATLQELVFFENGLFTYGTLDEDENISDAVLRRIMIPLAANDESYISILKRNSESLAKIVEKSDSSSGEFLRALETNCPSIISEEVTQPFISLLQDQSRRLDDLKLSD